MIRNDNNIMLLTQKFLKDKSKVRIFEATGEKSHILPMSFFALALDFP